MDGGNRSFDILRGLPELKYGRLFLSLKHSRVKDHNIIFYFFFLQTKPIAWCPILWHSGRSPKRLVITISLW